MLTSEDIYYLVECPLPDTAKALPVRAEMASRTDESLAMLRLEQRETSLSFAGYKLLFWDFCPATN